MTRPDLAFSIDFEGFVEAMEESFAIPPSFSRYDVEDELTRNATRCLELLDHHGARGTFFVLGWIGERFPEIVRRIAKSGHEIASHSLHHRRLSALPEAEAAEQARRSKAVLEDVSGHRVIGFRAPDFSLREDSRLLDQLPAMGFRYDSSLHPTSLHDVYSNPGGGSTIRRLPSGLIEFPASTHRALGFSLSVGGGGYFRLYPWWLTRRWLRAQAHPMTYLHPYEIGGVYPRDIPMSPPRRLRHTLRNGRLDRRLERLFQSFRALPVADYLEAHAGLSVLP